MKQYLADLFSYNHKANLTLLKALQQVPDNSEPVRLFSHLITAQDKWFNRIVKKVDDASLTWFDPIFPVGELEQRWEESCNNWLQLMASENDQQLERLVTFIRPADGRQMGVKLRDLVQQLINHSIHHRAQINVLIRQQGINPPATDYIFTVLQEL